MLNTPAYLVRVNPEIKLDDVTILTGPEMGLGSGITLTAGISSPNLGRDIRAADISRGISYTIGLPALTYAGTQLVGQIDRMKVMEGTLHDSINAMDTRTGELLHNIAIEYFGQLNNTSRSIEGVMHVQLTKMPSIALVSADADYDYIFGMPVSPPQMQGLGIDAIRVASSPMSIDGDLAQRKEFIKHRGLTSSYLEHKILENLLGVESISAVKALQLAAKNGIPIYTINSSNIVSILPLVTLSANDKSDIQNAVNAGKEVMVSRDNVSLYDWTGVGYIVRDQNTGTGTYMISNNLGGGGTVQASNPKFDQEIKVAWFIAGRPIKFRDNINWWFMEHSIDEIGVLPIWQKYGYIPVVVMEITDANLVKYAANYPYTWIFYYTGHGSSEKGNDYLSPAPLEFVNSSDIYNEAKIVFLNSCNSAKEGSFVNSFKINGYYKNEDDKRKEALVGFTSSSEEGFSDVLAVEFWFLMGQGKTVQEAVEYIQSINDNFITDILNIHYPIYLNITDYSKETTLIP